MPNSTNTSSKSQFIKALLDVTQLMAAMGILYVLVTKKSFTGSENLDAFIAGGDVTILDAVAVQPCPSVTVAVYVPGKSDPIVVVVPPPGDQEYV